MQVVATPHEPPSIWQRRESKLQLGGGGPNLKLQTENAAPQHHGLGTIRVTLAVGHLYDTGGLQLATALLFRIYLDLQSTQNNGIYLQRKGVRATITPRIYGSIVRTWIICKDFGRRP